MTEKKKNPLKAFVDHEVKAVGEVGKAVLSILPKGLREHGQNAITESAKGFEALGKGAVDAVESVVDEVKNVVKPSRKAHKVEVSEIEIDVNVDSASETNESAQPIDLTIEHVE